MDKLPFQIQNAFWFQAFNAISWQIALGSPLILFAQSLSASATTIGLLSGLAPLMSILQLPASRYAEDIGYRKLMLTGWSSRVFLLIFLFLLPFLGFFLPKETLVNLLLAIIFFFTIMRGISTCSWLPWITSIVPESIRGHYLGRERSYINMASIIALLLSGGILARGHEMGNYSLVFFLSFAAGAVSLYFLNRIPNPPPYQNSTSHITPIPWKEILKDKPFIRLLGFSTIVQLGLSAHGIFVVVFLKEQILLNDGTILWLTAGSAMMGMVALKCFAQHTDRVGSKPYLDLVWSWWIVYFFLWLLVSTHAIQHTKLLSMGLLLTGGFFGSTYDLAVTRLLLNMVGEKPDKTRYFAVYAVVVSLVVGLTPIPWGMVLDGLRHMNLTVSGMGMEWNPFSIFFGTEWLMLFVIGFTLTRVKEPESQPTAFVAYEIFVGMPARGLTLLLQRFQ